MKGIDQRLIADCIANQRMAQRRLYDLSLPYFTVIAKRYLYNASEVKDALQDGYLNLFRYLEAFDAERASFKTWATRIIINACLKRNATGKRTATEELVVERQGEGIPSEAIDKLSTEQLITWLKRMPEDYYQVFSLYAVDGFSHVEIAELLGIDPVLSRKRLSRARTWLKQEIIRDPNSPLSDKVNLRKDLMVVQFIFLIQTFIDGLPDY